MKVRAPVDSVGHEAPLPLAQLAPGGHSDSLHTVYGEALVVRDAAEGGCVRVGLLADLPMVCEVEICLPQPYLVGLLVQGAELELLRLRVLREGAERGGCGGNAVEGERHGLDVHRQRGWLERGCDGGLCGVWCVWHRCAVAYLRCAARDERHGVCVELLERGGRGRLRHCCG